MKLTDLRQFLVAANADGYASGDSSREKKEQDGSTTITFKKGDFVMHDNFFGGEPYGGREAIFYKDKPAWIMVYYGAVDKEVSDLKPIYGFLQESLRHMPSNEPFRGPRRFKKDGFEYLNNLGKKDLDDFYGKEEIWWAGKKVYAAQYFGGLVDQRSG